MCSGSGQVENFQKANTFFLQKSEKVISKNVQYRKIQQHYFFFLSLFGFAYISYSSLDLHWIHISYAAFKHMFSTRRCNFFPFFFFISKNNSLDIRLDNISRKKEECVYWTDCIPCNYITKLLYVTYPFIQYSKIMLFLLQTVIFSSLHRNGDSPI